MRLSFEDGLLLGTIDITFQGKTRTIDRVIIDTGASHSIIVADEASELGIYFEPGDKLVNSIGIGGEEYGFSKKVDRVNFGNKSFSSVEIDFGNLNGFDINGLIGLDLLKAGKFIIDLKKLELIPQE